ncbi:MAG: Rieske 2Fe-2S domain-containing protein [Immundisolibacteraceae bacterium]|nr:Rieske 2Fe-2S domain-containing protein [Immundisolibacteraceae bacterium]
MENLPFEPNLIDAMVHREKVHRRLFTDPAIFELEMERIFEKTWVYVGHEGEIPNSGDYRRSKIGLQPVIVVRNKADHVGVFINACRHRAATVCQPERGNARNFLCAYHGWGYDLDGKLVTVPIEQGQFDQFDRENYGLIRVAKVAIHAGFIFASFNEQVMPLEQHLGAAAQYLSGFVDLSPTGRLLVDSGVHKYEYPNNWKTQVENGVDGYHAMVTHGSFLGGVLPERLGRDISGMMSDEAPCYSWGLKGDHGMLDMRQTNRSAILGVKAENLPIATQEYQRLLLQRLGDQQRFEEVLFNNGGDGYNLAVYPNLFIIGSQIRMIQPVAVDKTEIFSSPTLLEGAPDEYNTQRLRSHEDFYGPASFGAPDDIEMFTRQAEGLQGKANQWLMYDRGLDRETEHADGVYSKLADESAHRALWAHYRRLMLAES